MPFSSRKVDQASFKTVGGTVERYLGKIMSNDENYDDENYEDANYENCDDENYDIENYNDGNYENDKDE